MASEEEMTSEQRMRTLQLNDKMALLNSNFLKQVQVWIDTCPHYNLTAPMKSYMKHVKELEDMYSVANKKSKILDELGSNINENGSTSESKERVIIKAVRRSGAATNSELNKSVLVSTPAAAPPRFSIGNVSAIEKNTSISGPMLTPAPRKDDSITGGGNGGRKRAIRGGGPIGGAESVVFRGADTSTNTTEPKYPKPLVTLPKPTPDFWTKKTGGDSVTSSLFNAKDENKTNESSKTVIPIFKFNTNTANNDEKKEEKMAVAAPKFPSFASPEKKTEEKAFSGFGFAPLGATDKTSNTGASLTSKPPLFAPLSSGGGLTFPSFTPSTTNPPASTGLTFGPPKTENGEEEEGEYVPPVAEKVEVEEPGCVFTTKCSVFKMNGKEFTKLGVNVLYLKENDGKKTVLIRAPTVLATVLLNALQNSAMKVSSAGDEKGEKIRLSCPLNDKEFGTFLIRFPTKAVADKVLSEIQANCK